MVADSPSPMLINKLPSAPRMTLIPCNTRNNGVHKERGDDAVAPGIYIESDHPI